eukprot:7590590-Pyramimonas_sp.AAC.1
MPNYRRGHIDRKFKGRVVFNGYDVIGPDKNVALFEELSSCPATMQASTDADAFGVSPGHDIQQADARQSRTQSLLGVAPTWARPGAPFATSATWPP